MVQESYFALTKQRTDSYLTVHYTESSSFFFYAFAISFHPNYKILRVRMDLLHVNPQRVIDDGGKMQRQVTLFFILSLITGL